MKALLLLAMLGVLARLVLAAASTGSFDAILWRGFAEQLSQVGLLELYRANPHFNHPPIPGLWAAVSYAIADATKLRFEFIFKLPMIASDAVVGFLIWKIWTKRGSKVFAGVVCALYAWNFSAILTSAYHCNTDSIYAMLALLAVYLVEEKQAHLLGGLALGAAINVKLIPVILIIPMLGAYRDWRLAARFLAGLAIGVIPFLPPLILSGGDFARNALSYTPNPAFWGFNHFLRELVRLPRFSGWAQPIMDRFHDLGRYIVLLAIGLFTLVMRRREQSGGERVDRYTLCAACAALFLIVTPGFGMQYAVLPIPLLMAASPFFGTLYGLIAGAGGLFVYWLSWTGTIPLESTLGTPDDGAPATLFGLLLWATLIAFVWKCLWTKDELPIAKPRSGWGAIAAIVLIGLLGREVIAWYSVGSADTMNLHPFGQRLVDGRGLRSVYEDVPGHNYGPLSAYWIAFAIESARWLDTHAPGRWPWYPFVLRQPMIFADALSALLLYRIWKSRRAAALLIVAAFVFSPITILISAFHGNYDSICAALCLLSADLLARNRSLLTGLALGLAINVKPLPALFVPVLMATCRDPRQLVRVAVGLTLMALPFIPPLIMSGGAFVKSVMGYHPEPDNWGVMMFFRETLRMPRFSAVAQALERAYSERGRWILIGAMLLLTALARRKRSDPYTAIACAAAVFLILAPGFGLQYLALATPLLFAVRPMSGFVYGLTAGLFAFFNYWLNWTGGWPIDATGIATSARAPGPQFGLLAWAVLVAFVWRMTKSETRNPNE